MHWSIECGEKLQEANLRAAKLKKLLDSELPCKKDIDDEAKVVQIKWEEFEKAHLKYRSIESNGMRAIMDLVHREAANEHNAVIEALAQKNAMMIAEKEAIAAAAKKAKEAAAKKAAVNAAVAAATKMKAAEEPATAKDEAKESTTDVPEAAGKDDKPVEETGAKKATEATAAKTTPLPLHVIAAAAVKRKAENEASVDAQKRKAYEIGKKNDDDVRIVPSHGLASGDLKYTVYPPLVAEYKNCLNAGETFEKVKLVGEAYVGGKNGYNKSAVLIIEPEICNYEDNKMKLFARYAHVEQEDDKLKVEQQLDDPDGVKAKETRSCSAQLEFGRKTHREKKVPKQPGTLDIMNRDNLSEQLFADEEPDRHKLIEAVERKPMEGIGERAVVHMLSSIEFYKVYGPGKENKAIAKLASGEFVRCHPQTIKYIKRCSRRIMLIAKPEFIKEGVGGNNLLEQPVVTKDSGLKLFLNKDVIKFDEVTVPAIKGSKE